MNSEGLTWGAEEAEIEGLLEERERYINWKVDKDMTIEEEQKSRILEIIRQMRMNEQDQVHKLYGDTHAREHLRERIKQLKSLEKAVDKGAHLFF
jgi:Na+/phosphate symporter